MTAAANLPNEIRMVIEDALQIDAAGLEGAGAQDPIATRGIDSVGMVRLLTGLEDRFGISIPPAEITPANFGSIEAITAMVQRLVKG